MTKLSVGQAQERENRMEEYMRNVQDREEALQEAMKTLAEIHSAREIELERYKIDLEHQRELRKEGKVLMSTSGS
jgi:hypothetical protein